MPNIQDSSVVNLEINRYGVYVYNLLRPIWKNNNIREHTIYPKAVVKQDRQLKMTLITMAEAEVRALHRILS